MSWSSSGFQNSGRWRTGDSVADRDSIIAYIAEVGGVFIGYILLNDWAARLPGVWGIICRIALPVLLILGWRFGAGQPWKIRDAGIVVPAREGWLECLWLVCFQATCLLGILLAIARFDFYSLLGFLDTARDRLNGYEADYGPFVFAIALFALIHLAWGGELLCRGLTQGLGTIRINAAAGAVASWLVFSAAAISLALRLGYSLIPDACLWGLFALIPGPICEAYYLRNRSLLPLMAARTASISLAFAGTGFFLYWYPDRSFSVALPLMWACFLALVATTIAGARRLYPFWKTAVAMLRVGLVRGSVPGICLFAIILADGLIKNTSFRLGACLTALMLVLILRKRPRKIT